MGESRYTNADGKTSFTGRTLLWQPGSANYGISGQTIVGQSISGVVVTVTVQPAMTLPVPGDTVLIP